MSETKNKQQDISQDTNTQQPALILDPYSRAFELLEREDATNRAEHKGRVSRWQDVYDGWKAERQNLYKANIKAAEIKEKEAALKTLFSSFGLLLGNREDYRSDIYGTRAQAQAIRDSERAKEQATLSEWMKRGDTIIRENPEYKESKAGLKMTDLYGDIAKTDYDWRKFLAGEQGKNKRAYIKGNQEKITDVWDIPINNGATIRLSRSLNNDEATSSIIEEIKRTAPITQQIATILAVYNDKTQKLTAADRSYILGALAANSEKAKEIISRYGVLMNGNTPITPKSTQNSTPANKKSKRAIEY